MRALRITLIIAVVLGVLFTALDRIAVSFAESEAAGKIRDSQGLPSTPEVSIKGFPFLTQVMDRRLDEVGISLSGITANAGGRSVEVTEVRAGLTGVTVGSGYDSAVAGRAEGSARISYEALGKAAPEGATIGWAGAERAAKGQVKLEGPLADVVKGAGVPVPDAVAGALGGRTISAYSTVELTGGNTLRLTADGLPELPVQGFGKALRQAVDLELKIEGMPAGIRLDRLELSEDGLRITGTGRDVALAG
ncbi:LmeA family phospholipid-binding protein [Streptomyces sp. NPDC001985]|uniref:LmeA family phospholipid-binding protein n=1 Tax=Streptomyces sp. NPDC001985 TaxID=3154406 RepID=UPI003332DC74